MSESSETPPTPPSSPEPGPPFEPSSDAGPDAGSSSPAGPPVGAPLPAEPALPELTTPYRRRRPPSPGGLFQSRYREVTLASIVFGVVVGTIMNAAITYAGLKIGFTIVGSSIAAVLGFGVLRGMLRKGSILEVNIGQTVGSAVNTPNSGVIFTVPVLFLLGIPLAKGATPNTNFWLLSLACVTGAVLGCAFIVPLRKQMLDIERLRFPSATAVGAILKSPGAGAKKAVLLLVSIVIAMALAAPHQLHQITFDADVAELDDLVFAEKIGFEDKLRTEMIDGWCEARSAPPEVVEHGRRLSVLAEGRAFEVALDELADAPVFERTTERARGLRERTELGGGEALEQVLALEAAGSDADLEPLEAWVDDARHAAFAAIAEATGEGAYAVAGYPDLLAQRVYAATTAEEDDVEDAWAALRSKKTGWTQRPTFGYSDREVRMQPEVDAAAGTADFAFNGLGQEDPVLTRRVDRDGNGRPDRVVDNTNVDAGRLLGFPDYMQLLFALAPFALGAGFLTGRAGLFVLAGGVLAYLIINPVLYKMGWMPATVHADEAPGFGYGNINRPLGIGLLLGGAMMGVIASFPSIKEALKSIATSKGGKAGRDELGLGVLATAVVLGGLFLFGASYYASGRAVNTEDPVSGRVIDEPDATTTVNGYTLGFDSEETLAEYEAWGDAERDTYLASIKADRPGLLADFGRVPRSILIAIVGALWIWFAGIIIAQCTGMTDWSPISGMALVTVVLIMVLAGVGDQLGAVMIGAALCVAITCAADMMADLKTGYIVGAQPKRQQIVELVSTGIGPVISMLVLLLIAAANMEKFGVPLGAGTDTVAPQAQALQAVIEGVRGEDMPYALYLFGAVAGALLGLGSFSGLGVLVGLSMYLPMNYLATYGIGCILNLIVSKLKGRSWAEEWGVPVAAGLIVGDALLGLGVNFVVLLQS